MGVKKSLHEEEKKIEIPALKEVDQEENLYSNYNRFLST